MNQNNKKKPIDVITYPVRKFMSQEKAGGIVLGINVVLALILANSFLSDDYFRILNHKLGFQYDGETYFNFSLLHWINDGLMAVFFFVVGLELKREIVGGELAEPRKAMLPIIAAIGGMVVPASIYLLFNPVGEVHAGWGIPMATDIAFAIGVLYLLGSRVPLALKVFLTALAIIDDLGAVIVIALFYSSDISLMHLAIGFGVLATIYGANKMGVRNVWFYAILGIGGVWTAFLMSGVHATIAAVLVAFLIPANMEIGEPEFYNKIRKYIDGFKQIDPNDKIPNLTQEQHYILEEIKQLSSEAIPPLQRLEHRMHPLVNFLVLPIFALANAGVILDLDPEHLFSTNVAVGVALGLLVGKVIGVMGFTLLAVKLKVAPLPTGMTVRNLFGLGLLAAIGFTMSLFITSLAFKHPEYAEQAKIGIFAASLIGGIAGYYVLSKSQPPKADSN